MREKYAHASYAFSHGQARAGISIYYRRTTIVTGRLGRVDYSARQDDDEHASYIISGARVSGRIAICRLDLDDAL